MPGTLSRSWTRHRRGRRSARARTHSAPPARGRKRRSGAAPCGGAASAACFGGRSERTRPRRTPRGVRAPEAERSPLVSGAASAAGCSAGSGKALKRRRPAPGKEPACGAEGVPLGDKFLVEARGLEEVRELFEDAARGIRAAPSVVLPRFDEPLGHEEGRELFLI